MSDYQLAGYPGNGLRAVSVTIPNGAAVTEMFASQGAAVVGVVMPAAWTAAALQFYGCLSGNQADLLPYKDATTGVYMQTLVAAADMVAFPNADALFCPFLQLKSVTAGGVNAVNQGADRQVIVLLRPLLT